MCTCQHDEELQGLHDDLSSNLHRQEQFKNDIARLEGELSGLENEQLVIERGILELQDLADNEAYDKENNNIYDDILNDVDLNLDQNEQGEIIH